MMEGEQDAFSENKGIFKDKEPRIKKGVTAGRVVNGFVTLNYFLVLLTALIVTGIFGVLNNKLANHSPITKFNSSATCILFSKCIGHENHCDLEYNGSGACEFVAAGFGIISFVALAYVIVSIVRIVLSTNIWWSVIADIVINICVLVGVVVMGITISTGLAVTCTSATDSRRANATSSCSASRVPDNVGGYNFYGKVNASQGAAWFCFMFVVFSLVVSIVRLCILFRRKASVPAMDDKEILTAEDKPV